jgi:hypothetical protein
MSQGYTCKCCGRKHDEIPLTFGADAPVYVDAISSKERAKRVYLERSVCIIDNEHFFVRGSIVIPILDDPEKTFSWGVWSTISQDNYEIMVANWSVEGREKIVLPAFGYLANKISLYGDTLNLNVLSHTMPVGQIPLIELEPTDHPLAIEQRTGITMARVHEIAKLLMPTE